MEFLSSDYPDLRPSPRVQAAWKQNLPGAQGHYGSKTFQGRLDAGSAARVSKQQYGNPTHCQSLPEVERPHNTLSNTWFR